MKIMRRLLTFSFVQMAMILIGESFATAQTNIISFTNRDGTAYDNVIVVRIDANGLIYRDPNGVGGGRIKLGDLPDDLLHRFSIDPTQARTHDKDQATQEAKRRLETAIAAGLFREVDGIVYDLRQSPPGWVMLRGVKMFQRLEDGAALVDPNPGAYYSTEVLHIKHMPRVSDSDVINITVKPIGTFDYINKAENTRSVRSYDAGRICTREEIPEQVLNGRVTFARIAISSKSLDEIIPSSDANSLTATGTGFFITDDGYLITNNHVVNGAGKLRIRTGGKTIDAHVVKTSKAFDLALLKAEGAFNALPLDTERKVGLGDAVFTIGFPNVEVQGAAPKYTDGKISSLSGIEDDPSQYQVTVPIQPGNSGGPLVADNGAVVGIVRAKLNDITALETSGAVPQNVNYAVKAKYLRDLLETVPEVLTKIKKPLLKSQASESVKNAENAVAIVLVY